MPTMSPRLPDLERRLLLELSVQSRPMALATLAGRWQASPDDTLAALRHLEQRGLVTPDGAAWMITDSGEDVNYDLVENRR